ncbi:PI31 proteasome regulator N-terminal-domain-containing protein [Amylocarpus encephaloides]|uniref:PI31 proteasome regulator N-terminal-domain-containing protein n=1 Tax=Amylocarpus encephaloides TaxID=45428 RepID=A0A9P7YCB2_9HELO|nr:PI31 proteasome regulator N-terminal-domain-containing protein [Amylocarpus encephaloides]
MSYNPLSSESILEQMAAALPTHSKTDTNSDCSSSYEAIALFSHACMVAVGCRIIGYHEDRTKAQEFVGIAPRLTAEWNSAYGTHSFLYAHSQSSMKYLLKVDRIGSKADIRGIGLGDEKITRLEITAKDYISSAALPLRITMTDAGEEDRSTLQDKLKEIFISPSRIEDLASRFNHDIISKLIPGIHKEGYEQPQSDEAARVHDEREEAHARGNPPHDPLAGDVLPPPARPNPDFPQFAPRPAPPLPIGDFPPPGFDDELDMNRPVRRWPHPAGSPFGIGDRDLNPPGLGPHDPLRDPFGGGGMGMGGGMHPTFDDPLFGGRGGQGGWGPQGNAPPGSRYDPPGPGGAPRGGLGGPGMGGMGGGYGGPFI